MAEQRPLYQLLVEKIDVWFAEMEAEHPRFSCASDATSGALELLRKSQFTAEERAWIHEKLAAILKKYPRWEDFDNLKGIVQEFAP